MANVYRAFMGGNTNGNPDERFTTSPHATADIMKLLKMEDENASLLSHCVDGDWPMRFDVTFKNQFYECSRDDMYWESADRFVCKWNIRRGTGVMCGVDAIIDVQVPLIVQTWFGTLHVSEIVNNFPEWISWWPKKQMDAVHVISKLMEMQPYEINVVESHKMAFFDSQNIANTIISISKFEEPYYIFDNSKLSMLQNPMYSTRNEEQISDEEVSSILACCL